MGTVEQKLTTFTAIYTSDYSKDRPIYTVLDSRVEQLFRFDIDMPELTDRKNGELIPVVIRIFPGQTEIKIEAKIENEYKRLSFDFEQLNDEHRKATENLHQKKLISRPKPKRSLTSKSE